MSLASALKRRSAAGLLTLAFVALPCAVAQTYVPTPYARCLTVERQMIEPGMPGYPPSAEEFGVLLKQALEHCPQGVVEQPKNPAPHIALAHALALSGDAAGAARAAKAAAELASQDAPVLLGALHARGQGVARDPAAALELLKKAARNQMTLAHYNLGVLHAGGEGVPQDHAEAFMHYRNAARNDVAAMLRVAQSYADGRGVQKNRAEAEGWWRRAAEKLFIEARDHPARLREREPIDPAQALEWFRDRAEAGEAWAQTFVGMLYERGVWVRQDFATAQLWYRKAAAQEFAPAEFRMAELFGYGRGVAVDREASRRWANRFLERQCETESRAAPAPTECDRLAGDPYDPQKAGPGVKTLCMPMFAERAVSACRTALKSAPQSARLRGQLARALLHAGDLEGGRKEAEAAARAGSTPAMALLAAVHENGYGVPKNPAIALDWYRKAADRGDERAMNHALRLYSARGDKDTPELRALQERLMEISRKRAEASLAAYSLEKLAESGDPAHQHNLAARFENVPVGSTPNYAEAAKWYRKAVAQGYGPSIYNLAQMHEKGLGVARDLGEAAVLYRKLAESAPGEARLRLAMVEAEREKYGEAHKWLNKAASDGDVRAMLELGIFHEQGRGVPRDLAKARQWFERAAPRSHWAEFKVGALHLQERNYAAALPWMRASADRGNHRALNNLAMMQERGLGMPRDEAAATEMYFRAAQAGSPEARATLDAMFEEGRGEPRGRAERVAWYRRGADLGLVSARYKLGQLYEEIGPTQDFAEAMKWYGLCEFEPRASRAMARLYTLGLGVPAEDMHPVKRAYIAQLLLAQAEKTPPRRVERAGFALDPGPDPMRTMQMRIAGTGEAHAAAMDMGWYDVLRPRRAASQR